MSGRLFLFAALLLTVGFAPAPFRRGERGGPADEDLRKMQGTWVVVQKLYDSQPVSSELEVQITGRRMLWITEGKVRLEWDLDVNAGASPRQLTSTPPKDGPLLLGIYRFEKDRLFVCQGNTRPDGFDARGESWLLELRRR